jgi:hypothetical protein
MLDIEVVVTIRESGDPGGDSFIQINEAIEYAQEPKNIRRLANQAVARAEAALLSTPRPEGLPE